MGAPKLTDAERATDRRGLVAARAALHGDMPVFGLDLPQAPARRTTRVVLDVDWDPRTEDDPTTWSWDLGVDADPGHIRVVTR